MFYDKFIYLCNLNDISPTAVLQKIGINKSNNTKWSNGSIPAQRNLKKLADYFNVPVSYLKGETEDPSADEGKGVKQYTVGSFEGKDETEGVDTISVNVNTLSDITELVECAKGLPSEKIQLLISVAQSMK